MSARRHPRAAGDELPTRPCPPARPFDQRKQLALLKPYVRRDQAAEFMESVTVECGSPSTASAR